MNDPTFLRQFEDCTWPAAEWRHRQHVKVAYLYLRKGTLPEAIEKIRASIKRFNAAHQVPETIERGYHETMTQAWMRLVSFTLQEYGPCQTADEFCDLHPELSQMKVLRFFYSRELLMSARAKAEYVEADITPLPLERSARDFITG
jgi:hypothetical protein